MKYRAGKFPQSPTLFTIVSIYNDIRPGKKIYTYFQKIDVLYRITSVILLKSSMLTKPTKNSINESIMSCINTYSSPKPYIPHNLLLSAEYKSAKHQVFVV